ncbi:MAG: helix-turn-helix transcriptional regulator, partial [Chromatiaceae bacterium]|nr:helix-turn-helix transcriptional regulator [Chromatiaceae bacterium]
MSQADIMRAVGVSNATASDWESGKTSPRGENLIKLCKHLRITTDWLVYGKGSLDDGQGSSLQPIAPGPEFVAIERVNLQVSAGV